jgi:hypothetical protein
MNSDAVPCEPMEQSSSWVPVGVVILRSIPSAVPEQYCISGPLALLVERFLHLALPQVLQIEYFTRRVCKRWRVSIKPSNNHSACSSPSFTTMDEHRGRYQCGDEVISHFYL